MTRNVLEYLEANVEKWPERTAVTDPSVSYTYDDLYRTSRKIGSAISALTAGAVRKPIGLFMDKGSVAVSVFFGAVYAGDFYSMLNPTLPDSRLQTIQSVLNASVIVTDETYIGRAKEIFGETGAKIVLAGELVKTEENSAVLDAVRVRMVDTDPLYVNFTSGSTGVPKGIVVGHRSVLDFIGHFTEIFNITEDDIIANQAPFDFDVSVKDIYSAMKTGAKLVIVPKELFSAPVALIDYLCEQKVTTMIWAVSALCLISTFHGLDYKTPETIRKVLFSGEVMPCKHLKTWRSHLPETMFVNLYGPTEITCNCTYQILDPEDGYEDGIPIGKAFPNEDVFLLDNEDKLVTEEGAEGEICVRGSALALGYYCLPKDRVSGFVKNPLNPAYDEMIYRTGDLARYDAEGRLVFSGRKDFQIKYQGHRIELEEIEREMAAIEGVERCCCVFDPKKERLYGFYLGEVTKDELVEKMKKNLPTFMIPGVIRQVEEMPITKNGKIDRNALMERGTARRNA